MSMIDVPFPKAQKSLAIGFTRPFRDQERTSSYRAVLKLQT